MGEAKRRRDLLGSWSENLSRLHKREEDIRLESIAYIRSDESLCAHLDMIEIAMTVFFHFATQIEGRDAPDDLTIRHLAIRLFNATATTIKLCLSGYGQTAAAQARDILETTFLIQHFKNKPEAIAEWRLADDSTRKRKFKPIAIREALDDMNGFTSRKRAEAYDTLSRLAAHPTTEGFAMLRRKGSDLANIGPFFNDRALAGVIEELAKMMAQACQTVPMLLAPPKGTLATWSVRLAALERSSGWLTKFFGAPPRTRQIEELRVMLQRLESDAH